MYMYIDIIYRIAANFRYLASEPSAEIFVIQIFTVQCQETTPTNSFAYEIPVCGSLSQFLFRVNYSALKKREMLHPTKISRYTV